MSRIEETDTVVSPSFAATLIALVCLLTIAYFGWWAPTGESDLDDAAMPSSNSR